MITLNSIYFHCMLPVVAIPIGRESAQVVLTLDRGTAKETVIYAEDLWAVEGQIKLYNLSDLLEPYLRRLLIATLTITVNERTDDGAFSGTTDEGSTEVVFGTVDIAENGVTADNACESFCREHFLSLLMGEKITAIGRLEYVHYIGIEEGRVEAEYDDGTIETFPAQKVQGNDRYSTLEVSAANYEKVDKQLVRYTVKAGDRSQVFVMDFDEPDCAPILLFRNSFGCQELCYCTGKHEVKPEYERQTAFIGQKRRNYHIREKRQFLADSGVLNTAMANWLDDLFRSQEIFIVNFVARHPIVGREVIITDSKSEMSNEYEHLPRFTFQYEYAQRNHNVLQMERAGRIFDNTFDNTFN